MVPELSENYIEILQSLKEKIRQARLQAAFYVNIQLLQLYWDIGNEILKQQKREGRGTKVISHLAKDLMSEFPYMKGLTDRNFVYMQTFARAWPYFPFTQGSRTAIPKAKNKNQILQQSVAKLPTPVITQAQLAEIHGSPIAQAPLAQLSCKREWRKSLQIQELLI